MRNEEIRVLLVDDDAETREIYTHYFRQAGFQIDEAENGEEGLKRIQETMPDIIISGIMMPRMDGFSFARALRENADTAHIPIIFLSHLGQQEDQNQLKAFGVDDFIVRGITPLKDVGARVRALLSVDVQEYILAVELESFDGKRFAADIGLPEDLTSPEEAHGRYVLRLRRVEGDQSRFDAKIISA